MIHPLRANPVSPRVELILKARAERRQQDPAHEPPVREFFTRDYPDAPPSRHRIQVLDDGSVLVDDALVGNGDFWVEEALKGAVK